MSNRTGTFTQFNTDDEYMTPTYALRDFFSYTKIDKERFKLWEPFYGDGQSGKTMKAFGYNVIECKDKDFFQTPAPSEDNVIMITNPPFSQKKDVLNHILNVMNFKRFAILIPSSTFFAKYLHKMIADKKESFQMLIPNARIQFVKNGVKTRCNALDTAWFVSGIDLPDTNGSLHFMPAVGPRDK